MTYPGEQQPWQGHAAVPGPGSIPTAPIGPARPARRKRPWRTLGIVGGAILLVCCVAPIIVAIITNGPDDRGIPSSANIGAAATTAPAAVVPSPAPLAPTHAATKPSPSPSTPKPKPSPTTTKPKPKPSTTKPKAPAPKCHPSYEGVCVPFASDVDCAGGSGNGPAYVEGPVYVVGPDVYDLDRDGDGVACEP
jgi:hypothetical protein